MPGVLSIERSPDGLNINLSLEDAKSMAAELVRLAEKIEAEKEARWQDHAKHQVN
jgi:hypothetical protein